MAKKKTFREKLADEKDFPKVQKLAGGMKKRFGAGTIVMASPLEVKELMDSIPKGKVTTINGICEILAERHGATMACPIVTGIQARIVSGAAGEDAEEGKKRITPYWRTLKKGGELNAKYPGGLEGQRQRLEDEGHKVYARGKRLIVEDYDNTLAKL